MPLDKPTVLSLFSGIGGFELGLERAGFQCVGQVEKNPYCLAVLEKHWPDVPRHDDVTSAIDWWESEDRPQVDLVCGGFPCQDISIAQANRTGLDGERSGLYWHALGTAVAVGARAILLENVSGLLSSNGGRDLGVILASLAECGYPYVEWRTCDSQYFGVPQRRRRVFLVASASDPRLGPLLLEPAGSGRPVAPKRRAQARSAASAGRSPAEGGGRSDAGGQETDPDGVRTTPRFSAWLDHSGQTTAPQAQAEGYVDADAPEADALEALRRLWAAVGEERREGWRLGVAAPLPSPEVLLACVYVGGLSWQGAADFFGEAHGARPSQETWPEGFVRTVREYAERGPSSPGPRQLEQLRRELDRPLPLLSHEGARDDEEGSDDPVLTISTLQGQPGARGYRLDAEAAAGGQLIVLPQHYQKVVRSGERDKNGDLPPEVWAQRDVSATLNMYDVGNTRAVEVVIEADPQPEEGCTCCPMDTKPDSNRFGTCGNAVSVPVIRWIGDRLYDELMFQKMEDA